jgi:hypothetical protein
LYLVNYHLQSISELVRLQLFNYLYKYVQVRSTFTVNSTLLYGSQQNKSSWHYNTEVHHISEEKKSMRWYRKIEVKLREVSIYNAYVLEGCVMDHDGPKKRKRDLMSFKLELAHSLIGKDCLCKSSPDGWPSSSCAFCCTQHTHDHFHLQLSANVLCNQVWLHRCQFWEVLIDLIRWQGSTKKRKAWGGTGK